MRALVLFASGCSFLAPHPPKQAGENTYIAAPPGADGPLKLNINDGADAPVCEVHIVPSGGARPGSNLLAGGEERSFIRTGYDASAKLKPGTYWVQLQLCNDAKEVRETELDLRANTILNLTFQERPGRIDPHVLGYDRVVDLYFTTPEYVLHPRVIQCTPDGGWWENGEGQCCSPYTHFSPQAQRQVCGP